jgi:hypothetical protein
MAQSINLSIAALKSLVSRVKKHEVCGDDWLVVEELVERYYEQQKRKWNKCLNNLAAPAVEDQPSVPQESATLAVPAPRSPAPLVPPVKKGHGKRASSQYHHARHLYYALENFANGQRCDCCGRKMYQERERKIIRIVGQPSFASEVHHLQQARCRTCGNSKRADYPVILDKHYSGFTFEACSYLICLHYLGGVPFNRLETMQSWLGTEVSDARIWDVVDQVDTLLMPVFRAFESEAVKFATSVRYDDTGSNIASVDKDQAESTRTINTSAFFCETPQGRCVLYYTGPHHAGEALDRLLLLRGENQPALVTTSDAANKNFDYKQQKKTVASVCNAHAYRRFKDLQDNYPEEFATVKAIYQDIYEHDEYCRIHHYSGKARLAYHRDHSLPAMNRLYNWIKEKIKSQTLEINLDLGAAIGYLANQWQKLTEFLRTPDVPLDSNLVEQVIKIVIRYRNNSRTYQNLTGAEVGDRMMSFGQTIISNQRSPYEYLLWCLNHADDVKSNPKKYTPLSFLSLRNST